jgi:hypothetical protein
MGRLPCRRSCQFRPRQILIAGHQPAVVCDIVTNAVSRCVPARVRRLEWQPGSGARVPIPSIPKSELIL